MAISPALPKALRHDVKRLPAGASHAAEQEPFWSLTIAGDRTVGYRSLINGADPITSLTQTTPAMGGGSETLYGCCNVD